MAKPLKGLVSFLRDRGKDVTGIIGDVITGQHPVGAIVSNILGSDLAPEDKEIALQRMADDLENNKLTAADRKDARDMYKDDDWLQKVFAITFLALYGIFTLGIGIMFWAIIDGGLEVNQFVSSTLSMVWGGITTKIGTITDFLYGGSFGQKQSERATKELFSK